MSLPASPVARLVYHRAPSRQRAGLDGGQKRAIPMRGFGVRNLKRFLLVIAALITAVSGWMIASMAPAGAAVCEGERDVEHHLRFSNTGGPSELCLPDFLNGTDLLWCDNNFNGDDPVWFDSTTADWIDYNTGLFFHFGRPGDIPVCGDWNGDGRDGIGVVRGATWFLRNAISGGPANVQFNYGRAGDVPLAGDWNADGRDTPGVRRENVWFLRNALSGGAAQLQFSYGRPDDLPLVGDYNGDRRDTPGVVRGREWFLRNSNTGGVANVQFTYGRGDELFWASADFFRRGIDTPIISRQVVVSGATADSGAARAPDWNRTLKR